MPWWEQVIARVRPAGPVDLEPAWLLGALALTLVLVLVPGVWRVVRLGVTLVHELGHAMIGVLVGRRFTGFVIGGDASGHAVTYGPARGPGRVATTWAGYPAPALLGALMAWAASRGWAAPVLTVLLLVLLASLVRVRSALTALATVAATALLALAWWGAGPATQTLLLTVLAAILVLGAWRHLGAVAFTRTPGSDPAVLAALTRIPRVVWLATFALVCAASTWVLGGVLLDLLP